ncbi:MAG: hypothetical protein KatS3mg104_1514 [Phycisphaerae bacterium]|nr:MAG: hypothetical protein KatS3mg104_1514 [Phycisphaerae bacterium]
MPLRSSPTPNGWLRELIEKGYKLASRGTDNHLILIDLRPVDVDLTGKTAGCVVGESRHHRQHEHRSQWKLEARCTPAESEWGLRL